MAERQPENFGEILFKSLGKGLDFAGANLVPFMQTERQNRMAELQLLMQQQAHQAQMKQAQINLQKSNIDLKEATRLSNMTVAEKKQEEAQAELAAINTFVLGAMGNQPMGGILGASAAVGQPPDLTQLGAITQAQGGIPGLKLDTGMASLDFTQPQAGGSTLDFLQSQGGAPLAMEYLTKTGKFANLGDGTPKTLSAENQEFKALIEKQYPSDIAQEIWQEKLQGIDPLAIAERNYQENVRLYTPVGELGMKLSSADPEVAAAQARSAQEAKYSPIYKADEKTTIRGIRKKEKAGEYTKREADDLVMAVELHFKNLYKEVLDYLSPEEEVSGE